MLWGLLSQCLLFGAYLSCLIKAPGISDCPASQTCPLLILELPSCPLVFLPPLWLLFLSLLCRLLFSPTYKTSALPKVTPSFKSIHRLCLEHLFCDRYLCMHLLHGPVLFGLVSVSSSLMVLPVPKAGTMSTNSFHQLQKAVSNRESSKAPINVCRMNAEEGLQKEPLRYMHYFNQLPKRWPLWWGSWQLKHWKTDLWDPLWALLEPKLCTHLLPVIRLACICT